MSHIAALADRLYAEEVARARSMNPGDKLLEGPRLFERSCRLMLDGIRHDYPGVDEETARTMLAARLARFADLERR
jgi:hypothetical protein